MAVAGIIVLLIGRKYMHCKAGMYIYTDSISLMSPAQLGYIADEKDNILG